VFKKEAESKRKIKTGTQKERRNIKKRLHKEQETKSKRK
jgi:hypothetical protein